MNSKKGDLMHCHQFPLRIAGLIFSIIALLHLLRLFFDWHIVFGTFVVPVWFSWIGLFVACALAFWMFKAATHDKCQ